MTSVQRERRTEPTLAIKGDCLSIAGRSRDHPRTLFAPVTSTLIFIQEPELKILKMYLQSNMNFLGTKVNSIIDIKTQRQIRPNE